MSCLAGVDAPYDGGFVLKNRLGFEGNPVAAKRTVAWVVFDGDGRRQLLELLNERAVGLNQEFGQLFVETMLVMSLLLYVRKGSDHKRCARWKTEMKGWPSRWSRRCLLKSVGWRYESKRRVDCRDLEWQRVRRRATRYWRLWKVLVSVPLTTSHITRGRTIERTNNRRSGLRHL